MIAFVKRYWLELIVFGAIFGVLLNNAAPDMTWINTDSDGVHYVYAADDLRPAHKGSSPLYLLFSHLILYIPYGTEFWRMAMISVVAGTAGSVLVYLIIRHHVQGTVYQPMGQQSFRVVKRPNQLFAIAGALIYGGSALAISQNTIVETYPLVTTVCLAIYYACLKEKWLTAAILIGVAGAIHPTAMLVIIPMLIAYKPLRSWRRLSVMAIFVLFYLYIPITNRPPYMWNVPNNEGGVWSFLKDSYDTAIMLSGGLAIYDLPKRLLDASGLVLLNVAIVGIVPLVYAFKNGVKWYKNVLFWLIVIPTAYYVSDLAPQTAVYLQPSIAFGAVAIGIGLSKLNRKWLYSTIVASIVLLSINAWYFDIGRTLDPNLSATKFYREELPKVPDGQYLMPYYGWEWAAIYAYNRNEHRDIIPIGIDTLVSPDYQRQLTQMGVKFEDNHDPDRLTRGNHLALSIVRLNENVWTTMPTDPRTYGAVIVPARGNEYLVDKQPTEPPAQWHWKPSNPYDIITGAIEITDWKFITLSNRNVMFYLAMFSVAMGIYWFIFILPSKRKKDADYEKGTIVSK